MLPNLCVKDGFGVCFYSHWVVVGSESLVPLKLHRRGLHLHCDQTRPWRSGWCIRALLDHSHHTVIVFKSSVQVKQNPQDSFYWGKNKSQTVLSFSFVPFSPVLVCSSCSSTFSMSYRYTYIPLNCQQFRKSLGWFILFLCENISCNHEKKI